MTRLIQAELLKLRTTRLSYGLLAASIGLTAVLAAVRAGTAGSGNAEPLDTAAGFTRVLTVIGFALLLAAIFGLTISSGEFRHNTATNTYLATPNRTRILVAKLIAATTGGVIFGVVGFAASTSVGFAFLASHGDANPLTASTILGDAAGAILGAALLAAVGVALGTLVRSQLGAVVGAFLWATFAEAILGGVFNSLGPYLPFTAATTLAGAPLGGGGFGYSGSPSATALPFPAAAALDAGIALLLALLAARTTLRRDIT
ncbi:MAG TPA: ABC transporter permease [Gaiellaceae bacterium]|nr:ABC transporter permease [Gaiellaceae bacterium]